MRNGQHRDAVGERAPTVEPDPACVTIREHRGRTSDCGTNRSTDAFAGIVARSAGSFCQPVVRRTSASRCASAASRMSSVRALVTTVPRVT